MPRYAHSLSIVLILALLITGATLWIGCGNGKEANGRTEPLPAVPTVLTYQSDGLRYTFHVVTGGEALFDVVADPGYLENLVPTRTHDARRLRRLLEIDLGVDSLDDLREAHRGKIEELEALGYL